MLIYSYPQLIAVSHVLRRLLMPRHSPYALFRLNFSYSMNDLHSCAFLANNFFGCLLLLISPFVQNVVFYQLYRKTMCYFFLLSKITLVFSQLSVSFSFFIRFSMNIFPRLDLQTISCFVKPMLRRRSLPPGGDDGNRTHYLLNAIQALSQVSYAPIEISFQS